MLRSVIVTGVVFFSLSLQAEVNKDFLVNLASKFRSTLGQPLTSSAFQSELNGEELKFLEETQNYDYRDIFHGTLPKDDEVYSYNFLHLRGLSSWIADRNLNTETDCRMVSTEDGTSFRTHKMKVFRNLPTTEGRKEWRFSFCAGQDINSDIDSVVYYFHGASGNPYNFVQRDATYAVRERWRQHGSLPRWISVSLGSIGHMGEIGMEEKFFNIIVPYIERELGFTKRPKQRFGFGISQGGANVVHAVLKREDFFDAAVAICPAVGAVAPFATKEEIKEYRVRTASSRILLRLALHFMPREFFEQDYWHKYVDALSLAQIHLSERSTPLYIQTSSKDELGLQEGGQIFAMLARTMGAPVMFEELKGGHCVLRPHKVADFFKDFQNGELPLQLKMHGRTRR